MKLTCKSGNLILTSAGRWSFAIGLERSNTLFSKESLAWIDSHNIYQTLTTLRMFRCLAVTLSRSTRTKADILSVGRWKRSQASRSSRR